MTDTPTDREAVERLAKIHDELASVKGVYLETSYGHRKTADTLRALLYRAEAAEAKLEAYSEIISDICHADADADEWLEKNFSALTLKTERAPRAKRGEQGMTDEARTSEWWSLYGMPTPELRFVVRNQTIMGTDRDGQPAGVGSCRVHVLQQKWEITTLSGYPEGTEWRDVPAEEE